MAAAAETIQIEIKCVPQVRIIHTPTRLARHPAEEEALCSFHASAAFGSRTSRLTPRSSSNTIRMAGASLF